MINAIKPIMKLLEDDEDQPSLKDEPSIKNIYSHIMISKPKQDWCIFSTGLKTTALYQEDVNLRMEISHSEEGTQRQNYIAEWANCFIKPSATGYWCDIFFGPSHVKRTILVDVDEGRAYLPIPRDRDENDKLLVVDPFDYRIAEIFDEQGSLYGYFNKAGLKL